MTTEHVGSASPAHKSGTWRQRLIRWSPRAVGGFVLLFLAYLGVDFAAGIKLLRHARPEYFVPAFGVYLLSVVALISVWVLIAGTLQVGYQKTLSYVRVYLLAMFTALGIPQGAASFTRLALIAADKRSVSRGLVAVGAERLVMAAVSMAMLLLGSVYLSTLSIEGPRWLTLGIFVLIVAAFSFLVAARMGIVRPLIHRVESYSRIRNFLGEIKVALLEIHHLRLSRLSKILTVAFLAALLDVTTLYLCSRALNLEIHFLMILAAWSAVSLTSLLPISINGFGPREGILAAAVTAVGFGAESGVALGLLWFIIQAMARLTGGLLFFTLLHKSREPFQPELRST